MTHANTILAQADSIKMDADILDQLAGEYFSGQPMDAKSINQLCQQIIKSAKAIQKATKGKTS